MGLFSKLAPWSECINADEVILQPMDNLLRRLNFAWECMGQFREVGSQGVWKNELVNRLVHMAVSFTLSKERQAHQ